MEMTTTKSYGVSKKLFRQVSLMSFVVRWSRCLKPIRELYKLEGWERIRKGILRRVRWTRVWFGKLRQSEK